MVSPTLRRITFAALGITLGFVFFWLAARRANLEEVGRLVAASNWRWVILGVLAFGADLFIRVVRWRAILADRAKVSFWRVGRGFLVGYAVNVVLPARLGELFRADYTARISYISRTTLLASIFVERLLDLFAVLTILSTGLLIANVRDAAIGRVIASGALSFGVALVILAGL